MKTIVVFIGLVAVAIAAPQRGGGDPKLITVVKESPSNNIGVDAYQWSFEQSDGQVREESAEIENRGPEEVILRIRGSFSWVNPEDGKVYTITYIADENGFQPQGAHLPVSP